MTKILTTLIIVAIATLGFLIFSGDNKTGQTSVIKERILANPNLTGIVTHEVILTKDGYEPKEVIIKKGEAIVFSTTRNNFFWPASNIHPSHYIYQEFDPKIPVKPDQTWAFIFEEVGVWKYHDHLNPIYSGVVEVEE